MEQTENLKPPSRPRKRSTSPAKSKSYQTSSATVEQTDRNARSRYDDQSNSQVQSKKSFTPPKVELPPTPLATEQVQVLTHKRVQSAPNYALSTSSTRLKEQNRTKNSLTPKKVDIRSTSPLPKNSPHTHSQSKSFTAKSSTKLISDSLQPEPRGPENSTPIDSSIILASLESIEKDLISPLKLTSPSFALPPSIALPPLPLPPETNLEEVDVITALPNPKIDALRLNSDRLSIMTTASSLYVNFGSESGDFEYSNFNILLDSDDTMTVDIEQIKEIAAIAAPKSIVIPKVEPIILVEHTSPTALISASLPSASLQPTSLPRSTKQFMSEWMSVLDQADLSRSISTEPPTELQVPLMKKSVTLTAEVIPGPSERKLSVATQSAAAAAAALKKRSSSVPDLSKKIDESLRNSPTSPVSSPIIRRSSSKSIKSAKVEQKPVVVPKGILKTPSTTIKPVVNVKKLDSVGPINSPMSAHIKRTPVEQKIDIIPLNSTGTSTLKADTSNFQSSWPGSKNENVVEDEKRRGSEGKDTIMQRSFWNSMFLAKAR